MQNRWILLTLAVLALSTAAHAQDGLDIGDVGEAPPGPLPRASIYDPAYDPRFQPTPTPTATNNPVPTDPGQPTPTGQPTGQPAPTGQPTTPPPPTLGPTQPTGQPAPTGQPTGQPAPTGQPVPTGQPTITPTMPPVGPGAGGPPPYQGPPIDPLSCGFFGLAEGPYDPANPTMVPASVLIWSNPGASGPAPDNGAAPYAPPSQTVTPTTITLITGCLYPQPAPSLGILDLIRLICTWITTYVNIVPMPQGTTFWQEVDAGRIKMFTNPGVTDLAAVQPGQAAPAADPNVQLPTAPGLPPPAVKLAPACRGVPYLEGAITFHFNADRYLRTVKAPRKWEQIQESQVAFANFDATGAVGKAMDIVNEELPGCKLTGNGQVQEYLIKDERDTAHPFHQRTTVELILGPDRRAYRLTFDENGRALKGINDTGDNKGIELGGMGAGVPDFPDANVITKYDKGDYGDDWREMKKMSALMEPPLSRDGWMLEGTETTHPLYFISHPTRHKSYVATEGKFDLPRTYETGWWIFSTTHPKKEFQEYNAYWQLEKARKTIAEEWGFKQVNEYRLHFDTDPPGEIVPYPFWISFVPPNTMRFWPMRARESWASGRGERLEGGWAWLPEDQSLIWHEYGHMVMSMLNPNWNIWNGRPTLAEKAEPYVIAEGFADFVACCLTGKREIGLHLMGENPTTRQWLFWHEQEPIFASPFRRTIADDNITDEDAKYPRAIQKWIVEEKISTYHPKDFRRIKVPNVWMAGKLFSGLCWDIREELKRADSSLDEAGATKAAAQLVFAAIRDCSAPITFRSIKESILAVDGTIYGDQNHAKIFTKPGGVFDRRKL